METYEPDLSNPHECGYPLVWKYSYTIHIFSMTALVLIGLSFCYLLFLRNKIRQYTLSMGIIIIVIFASYVGCVIKNGNVYRLHGIMSIVIIIVMIFQIILVNMKQYYGVIIYLIVFLCVILVPLNWMIGLNELITNNNIFVNSAQFGHIGPGIGFYVIGVVLIFNYNNIDKVMFYEILLSILMGLLEFWRERCDVVGYGNDLLPHRSKMSAVWGHITVDICLIIAGLLCLVYKYIAPINIRHTLHSYTIGMVLFLQGYLLSIHHLREYHQEPIEGIHKYGGFIIILGSILRSLEYIRISGIISIIFGVLFAFSNPYITGVWSCQWEYPGFTYISFVLLFGFIIAIIHVLLKSISEDILINKSNESQKYNIISSYDNNDDINEPLTNTDDVELNDRSI